jgi:surface polysaccharide O-acyltransferase-like enzyme
MQLRGLSRTVLGIYLVAVGIVPYLPFRSGLMPLVSLTAIVAGVLLLVERRR